MPTMSPIDKQVDFGPHLYGATLHIDEPAIFDPNKPVALDVETDEKDNFVGVGMCQSDTEVYYWSRGEWGPELRDFIWSFTYIMHGGIFDIQMLQKWGLQVGYSRIAYDTKIMAYTKDTTLHSYGLKPLAKQFLQMEWPSYKEMLGRRKTTLNKQPIERVGRYCGMDVLATYKLYSYLSQIMASNQIRYFRSLEMPTYILLAKMMDKGVHIDVPYLKALDEEFGLSVISYERALDDYGDFNPRSPKQLLAFFKERGYKFSSTATEVLSEYKSDAAIESLLNYRKYKKLQSTYTAPFLKSFSLPRLHGRFYQSTLTGRLASSKPNLQNIPAPDPELNRFHDDVGTKIRKAFTAPTGKKLLVADYSQIEYRLFAHFTVDPVLLEVYKNGEDIHRSTATLVGGTRRVGKTLNFAAIYGAGSKKIAQTANISEDQASEMLTKYWNNLLIAAAWLKKVKWKAHEQGGVFTLFGRFIPLVGLKSANKFERFHAERVAVNAIIQGSAAEIMKKAMLDIYKELGLVPVLQVHDELVYELDKDKIEEVKHEVVRLMEEVVDLSVPLEVSAEVGTNWADCKSG